MPVEPVLAADAYHRVRARLAAVPADDLVTLSLSPVTAAIAVLRALLTLGRARADLAALRGFDLTAFDGLADLAHANVHLAALHLAEARPNPSLDPLRARAELLVRLLYVEVTPLVQTGLLPATTLPPRPRGRGALADLAVLLLGLARDLGLAWPSLEGHTTLDRDRIRLAAELGQTILDELAARRLPDDDHDRLEHERRAAFTLLVRDYEEARRAYAYLTHGGAKAMANVPPLHQAGFGRRKPRPATAPNAATTDEREAPARNRRRSRPRSAGGHDDRLLFQLKGLPAMKSSKKTSSVHPKTSTHAIVRHPHATATAPTPTAPVETSAPALDSSPYAAAYARCKATIDAVADTDLLAVNVDIPVTLYGQATLLAVNVEKHADEIAEELPRVDLARLRTLSDLRDAVMHTYIVLSRTEASPTKIAAMQADAIERRRRVVAAFEALAAYGLIGDSRLADMRAAGRSADVAVGLIGICSALAASWDTIAARSPVTRDEITEAYALGKAIITANATKGLDPEALADAAKDRQRAFTAFVAVYKEAQRALRYVRAPFGDADTVAPSLWTGQSGRSASEPPPASTPAPVAATPTAPEAAKPVTNGAPTFAAVPVGHPGGNPFAS